MTDSWTTTTSTGSSTAEAHAQSMSNPLRAVAMLFLVCNPMSVSFNPSTFGVVRRKSFNSAIFHPVMKAKSTILSRLEKLFQGALLLQDTFEEHVTGRVPLESWEKARFSEIAQNAHIAPSSRHGLGLFASRDLEEDTLVTFYPIHKVGSGEESVDLEDDKSYWDTVSPSLYKILADEEDNVFVDCNPHREDVMGWLGHRANDAARCSGTSEDDILKYRKICERECNLRFWGLKAVRPLIGFVTTRPVQKGEELLVSYSDSYWNVTEGVHTLKVDISNFIDETDFIDRDERWTKLYQHEINCFENVLQEAGLSVDGSVTQIGFGDKVAKDFDTIMRERSGYAGKGQKARKAKKKRR